MVYGVLSYSHKEIPLNELYNYDIKSADVSGIEALILRTCNRIELYCYSNRGEDIENLFSDLKNRESVYSKQSGETFFGKDAVKHAFKVASGLESIIVGENEILGQVRQAFNSYNKEKGYDNLSYLFENAIMVGKKARRDYGLSDKNQLYNHTVKRFTGLYSKNDKVALVGSGEVAASMVRRITYLTNARPKIFSRNESNAAGLADKFGLEYGALETDRLEDYDIILSAIKGGMAAKLKGPKAIIDLSVPPAFSGENVITAEDIMKDVSQKQVTQNYISSVERLVDVEADKFAAKRGV